jgi:hypothetical protein
MSIEQDFVQHNYNEREFEIILNNSDLKMYDFECLKLKVVKFILDKGAFVCNHCSEPKFDKAVIFLNSENKNHYYCSENCLKTSCVFSHVYKLLKDVENLQDNMFNSMTKEIKQLAIDNHIVFDNKNCFEINTIFFKEMVHVSRIINKNKRKKSGVSETEPRKRQMVSEEINNNWDNASDRNDPVPKDFIPIIEIESRQVKYTNTGTVIEQGVRYVNVKQEINAGIRKISNSTQFASVVESSEYLQHNINYQTLNPS